MNILNSKLLDPTVTLSLIIAIAALFAPSITSVINNRHLRKMKDKDDAHEINKDIINKKIVAIETYMSSVGDVIMAMRGVNSFENRINYSNQYAKALLYVSEPTAKCMKQVHEKIVSKDFTTIEEMLQDLSKYLSKEIEVLKEDK